MTDNTIIRVDQVSKRFIIHKDKSLKERIVNIGRRGTEDFWALRDVSLDIPLGSTVGLVGHNGSGKSTLLKTIGGIIEPTSGTVSRRGRMAALLELGAGFHQDLTGRENVYLNAAILGLTRRETDRYFDAIVDFSGIEEFIDTQVKFYSSGMYVRLAFAVAVHVDPDLLLVDEVLAVGDEPFQRKCMEKIAEFQAEGRTIVLVSHSAAQVGSLCDRVVVLHAGNVMHDGDPAEGLRQLRAGYEADRREAEHSKQQSGIVTTEPYHLHSADAYYAEDLESGDITLRLQVDINDPREEWGVGVALETGLGTSVYNMTTFGMPVQLPNTVGRHEVTIVLPNARLGAGQYLVNVGIGDAYGRTYHRVAPAATFEIPHDDIGQGLVRFRPSVTLT
ncbi:ABC transporter ATP-binding protein [Plantibacter sp. ME-Dv--P-122b]|uniref:ABC transporter ATP-binding protein n=1 Tax=Plantibacter sp. ME-Dv--P-122b TaxID=3040300 RepID=UPI00254F0354|nr:ABC transporter ATP-binding protein [Plantibacter sp. ME-Dv--P-122b]